MKSTVDWCEYNYTVVPFIAEFWNTLTGLALCISSFVFYKNNSELIYNGLVKDNNNNNNNLNRYLINANYLLFIVGIGTIFFHGTLLYIFQLFDEIPMLLITFDYIYILLTINKSNYVWFYYTKYIWCFIIITSYWIHPTLQIITFFTFFTTNICIIIIVLLYKIHPKYKTLYKETKVNYLPVIGFMGVICLTIWIIDSLFCKCVQHLYLHSIWHIVTSVLVYLFNNLLKIYIKEYNFTKNLLN